MEQGYHFYVHYHFEVMILVLMGITILATLLGGKFCFLVVVHMLQN